MRHRLHLFLIMSVELCLTPNTIDQSIMKDERMGSNIQNGLGVAIEVSAYISVLNVDLILWIPFIGWE